LRFAITQPYIACLCYPYIRVYWLYDTVLANLLALQIYCTCKYTAHASILPIYWIYYACTCIVRAHVPCMQAYVLCMHMYCPC